MAFTGQFFPLRHIKIRDRRVAFGLRRKQLIRVVRTVASLDAERAAALLAAAGLDNEVRPETLTAADFARLVRVLTPRPDSGAHS